MTELSGTGRERSEKYWSSVLEVGSTEFGDYVGYGMREKLKATPRFGVETVSAWCMMH
jgi:hypothetical protein